MLFLLYTDGLFDVVAECGFTVHSLTFFTLCAGTQFQAEPRQRVLKIHGVRKFGNFRLKSPFISETVRDRPMVTMER